MLPEGASWGMPGVGYVDSGVRLGDRYGAFALAMILSLAAAVPIVFVCQLPDCARKKNPLQSWGRASRFTD